MSESEKGSRYVCIKDVYLNGNGDHVYKKGNVYTSDIGGCITNENGNKEHLWLDTDVEVTEFIPYSKLDRVYTKYTERLEKLFDGYDGKKKRTHFDNITFFDNCDANLNTGWFYATDTFEEYYKDENYTYLSEQAFIEFMGLTDTTDTKAPQPHYDNSNGSLFSLAEQLGLNHWEFDILKRLVRCRKKGQFKEDLQKIKDTCDIYLKESPH